MCDTVSLQNSNISVTNGNYGRQLRPSKDGLWKTVHIIQNVSCISTDSFCNQSRWMDTTNVNRDIYDKMELEDNTREYKKCRHTIPNYISYVQKDSGADWTMGHSAPSLYWNYLCSFTKIV